MDLNLSFFGGQFKELISSGEFNETSTSQIIACDQVAFFKLAKNELYLDRQVVICGLGELETSVTSNIGTKASWGYITYLLKSFYNFELNIGQEKYKTATAEALTASDLFFGLVNALLQTDPPSFQYYKIFPNTEYEENYQKILNI